MVLRFLTFLLNIRTGNFALFLFKKMRNNWRPLPRGKFMPTTNGTRQDNDKVSIFKTTLVLLGWK